MSEAILAFPKKGWLGLVCCADVRKACVEACLDAMLCERRFTYTDMFIR